MTETPNHTAERCEWNPTYGRWAYTGDDGCPNEATICVGADGFGHVCYECSLHPRFRRMKKSALPGPAIKSGAVRDGKWR